MQQLIYFIQKFKYFLLFVILEIFALSLIVNNLNFANSKFLNSTNFLVGGFYNKTSQIKEYFHLKKINENLVDENEKLKNIILQNNFIIYKDSIKSDSLKIYYQKYEMISAKIINNNFANEYNYLTLNIGDNQHVKPEMAVINHYGIIGIIDQVSKNYSRVQSILNKNTRLNARLKNSAFFGTLIWDGNHPNFVKLIDMPRQAPVKIGDTIETGGKSTIFPEAIPIGKVSKIHNKNDADHYIMIELFNDMRNINYVYIVKNLHKEEIQQLENPTNE